MSSLFIGFACVCTIKIAKQLSLVEVKLTFCGLNRKVNKYTTVAAAWHFPCGAKMPNRIGKAENSINCDNKIDPCMIITWAIWRQLNARTNVNPFSTHFLFIQMSFRWVNGSLLLLLWRKKLYDFITFSKTKQKYIQNFMCLYVFGFVGMFIENHQINTLFLIVSHLCSFWPGIWCRLYTSYDSSNSSTNKNIIANGEIDKTACSPLYVYIYFIVCKHLAAVLCLVCIMQFYTYLYWNLMVCWGNSQTHSKIAFFVGREKERKSQKLHWAFDIYSIFSILPVPP